MTCPHCGHELRTQDYAAHVAEHAPDKRSSVQAWRDAPRGGKITVIAIGVVVFGFLTFAGNRDSATPTTAAPSPIAARHACENAVRARLKAPATAEFGAATEFKESSTRYRFSSTVDAENSFGALLRMTWTCTVEATDGETWEVVTVDLNE